MTDSGFKWLNEELTSFGVVPLDTTPSNTEALTLKSPPELPPDPPSSFSIRSSFQIDTEQVVSRLKRSSYPFSSQSFFGSFLPDLYSPFWISTTLVLVLSAASNYRNHKIYLIVSVSSLLYSLSLLIPACLYYLLSDKSCKYSYYTLLSLYGYSWSNFVIAALLSFLPFFWLRFLSWVLAGGLSVFFLKQNLWQEISSLAQRQRFAAIGLVVGGHVLVIISTNFYFLADSY